MQQNEKVALSILRGKTDSDNIVVPKKAVLVTQMPDPLWRTFGSVAEARGIPIFKAAREAVVLWLKENWSKARRNGK